MAKNYQEKQGSFIIYCGLYGCTYKQRCNLEFNAHFIISKSFKKFEDSTTPGTRVYLMTEHACWQIVIFFGWEVENDKEVKNRSNIDKTMWYHVSTCAVHIVKPT